MAIEQFANIPSTTLDGGIDNVVTSLIVVSAASFPNAGQFRIKIGGELLLVTAVAGATFTVTRGIEGTTAASHADDAPVDGVVTAGAIAKLKDDVFVRSTRVIEIKDGSEVTRIVERFPIDFTTDETAENGIVSFDLSGVTRVVTMYLTIHLKDEVGPPANIKTWDVILVAQQGGGTAYLENVTQEVTAESLSLSPSYITFTASTSFINLLGSADAFTGDAHWSVVVREIR